MRTLYRLPVLLPVVFLIQACGTSNGLVTRARYNDRYYIGMSKREKPEKTGKIAIADDGGRPPAADQPSPAPVGPFRPVADHDPATGHQRPAAIRTPRVPSSVDPVRSTEAGPTAIDNVYSTREKTTTKPVSCLKKTVDHHRSMTDQSTDEDALSLLWVIVVVMVVLWVIGLLAGGLGIGGILNLLLVAALVLLILWLFRIL